MAGWPGGSLTSSQSSLCHSKILCVTATRQRQGSRVAECQRSTACAGPPLDPPQCLLGPSPQSSATLRERAYSAQGPGNSRPGRFHLEGASQVGTPVVGRTWSRLSKCCHVEPQLHNRTTHEIQITDSISGVSRCAWSLLRLRSFVLVTPLHSLAGVVPTAREHVCSVLVVCSQSATGSLCSQGGRTHRSR